MGMPSELAGPGLGGCSRRRRQAAPLWLEVGVSLRRRARTDAGCPAWATQQQGPGDRTTPVSEASERLVLETKIRGLSKRVIEAAGISELAWGGYEG